jgi:hypothetical protein
MDYEVLRQYLFNLIGTGMIVGRGTGLEAIGSELPDIRNASNKELEEIARRYEVDTSRFEDYER